MNYDYGKKAYFKAEGLEKRVAVLESAKPSPKYLSTDMSFKLFLKSVGAKTVVFRAIGAHTVKISIGITTSGANAEVKFNGETIALSGGSAEVSVPALNGENALRFTFSNAQNEWAVVSLSVDGYLEEQSEERFLSSVGGNYYSYFDGGTFYLYSTSAVNPVVALYEVRHASANYSSAGIFVSKIDSRGNLVVQRYYPDGTLYVETTADGRYSKCLVRVKYGYVILYVISGNFIKTGLVEFSGATSLTRTALRAKDLAFRTVDNSDYLLATDIDGTAYLCLISPIDFTTVTEKRSAGKIERARLSVNSDRPAIWHYKGGAVIEKYYDGTRFIQGGTIAVADEGIITDGGVKVIRVGNDLTII